MPRERIRAPLTALATTRPRSADTPSSLILTLGSVGATAAAAIRPGTAPFRLEASSPIHGEFSTCTATRGNGPKIAGHQLRRKSQPTGPHFRALAAVNWASYAAAVG